MGYAEAEKIRKTGLSNLIANRLVEGEGIGASFSKSLSERTKANITGLKQKVDYLNIAKKVFGGSNLAPALLGRLTGRSNESIRFFAGKGSAKPVSDKATKIDGAGQLEQTEAIYETLDNIYGFLKDSRDEDERKKQEEEGKLEENELEKKRRHDDLLKLLAVKPEKPTATKVEEEKDNESFLEKFLRMLGISKDLWKNLKFALGVLGLVGGMVGFYGGLLWLVNKMNEITPNMKALSPEEARNILESGSPKDIEAAGGRQYLENIILNRRQEAVDALAMEPGEERDKRILELGGEEKLKKIVADETKYEVPAPRAAGEDMAEKLPFTKEQFVGKGTARRVKEEKWNKQYAPFYNDDGTLKEEFKVKKPDFKKTSSDEDSGPYVNPPVLPKETAAPVAEPPASSAVAAKTSENLDLQLPKPVTDAAENVVNNTTVNSQDTNQNIVLTVPSVRNQEPSFQDMILYSTRVV